MPNIETEDMWKKWMAALQATVFPNGIGKGQQFSAASATLNVDLANKDPYISNYNIYNTGNIVPANGPAYAPASSIISSYATFLDWINLGGDPNPNLDSQINIAAANLNNAQKNFGKVQKDAVDQFKVYKEIDENAKFDAWVSQQYPTYQEAYDLLEGATAEYSRLMVQKYGEGYKALQYAKVKVDSLNGAQNIIKQNSFNMQVKLGSIAPPGSQPVLPGMNNPESADNLVSTFAPSYALEAFSTVYSEWQNKSTRNIQDYSVEISADSSTYSYDKFGWDASIKASWIGQFFRIFTGASTSGEKVNINTSSKNFGFSIKFTGLGSFRISPGLWWDNGMVSTYHNKLKPNAPDFFGKDGSLARIPYQIVVGFEPTIELKMDANEYSSIKTDWKAKAAVSIGIGPFRIGSADVSTYGKKEDIQWNDASAKVTIGPIKSTMPILLAVLSQQQGI